MKSFTTQILLLVAALFFLMKGGVGLLVGSWKLLLPIAFLGGAYYFGKKALSGGGNLKGAKASSRMKGGATNPVASAKSAEAGEVIEICSHCLAEVGSCPHCRK